MGFGKGVYPTQGPGFMGIFVSAWQRYEDTNTRSFQFSFFNSFFTHTIFVCRKQSSTTKVLMQMAPPLTLPSLGFRHFPNLIQPLLIRHRGPTRGATGPIEHWPGRGSVDLFPTDVQTVFFQEGDGTIVIGHILMGCFFDLSSQDGFACSRGRHSGPWSHWK